MILPYYRTSYDNLYEKAPFLFKSNIALYNHVLYGIIKYLNWSERVWVNISY